LDFLEVGDGLSGFLGQIQRESRELNGLGIVRIFSKGALKRRYCVLIIALSVVDDTEFVSEVLGGAIGFGDFVEGGERFIELTLFG